MKRRISLLGALFVMGLGAHSFAAAPSAKAQVAFDKAEKALASGQLDAALEAYKAALADSPGFAAALNGMGSALFKQGKKDEAIAQFKAAISADANFKLAHFNLGYAARKTGDFSTAAEAYEKYTALAPEDPDGFYGLGECYRQLAQGPKAIAAYETFIFKEKRPSEQKWIEKAKAAIAELKAAPVNEAAPANTAVQAVTASATSPVAAQNSPELPAPGLAQKSIAEGDRWMKEKKYREASFAYQDAVNADPKSVEGLFKLGTTYAVLGYHDQAIDRWNRASQLTDDPAIRKSAQDNIAKAQAKVAKSGASSPQAQGMPPGSGPVAASTRAQARAAYEQGVQEINQSKYTAAVKSLASAIQLEPTLTVAYVARGSAFIGLGRYAEAAADYQYALKLEPNMASPLYGLGEAYRALARPADARAYYEKYIASSAADVRPELQSEARSKIDRLR